MLEGTDLKNLFLKIGLNEKLKSNLIFLCAINLSFQFCCKGEILFNEGDNAHFLYIIIKGCVQVLRATENKLLLNGEEYLNIIVSLYRKGIREKLHKTIYANESLFPIDKVNLPYLEYIVFIIKLKIYLQKKTKKTELKDLFNKYQIDPSEFDINFSLIEENYNERKEYNDSIINKIITKYIGKKIIHYQIYNYLENENDYKNVLIYDNHHVISLKTGSVFGDMALDDQNGIR